MYKCTELTLTLNMDETHPVSSDRGFPRAKHVNLKFILKYKTFSLVLKGVLHPMPVFGLFLHFSQKLQHIGNK